MPIDNRQIWDSMHASGDFMHLINSADDFLDEPYPQLTDEIYLSFFNSNDSERSKNLIVKRRNILSTWVLAECLTDDGKYLGAIKHAILDIIALKSWNFPAEDRQKTNFHGTQYTINLSPAAYAHELAQTMYLLGDRLDNTLRKKLLKSLYIRVFDPALQAVETNNANKAFVSLTNTGNHNAVTLSGVTGAALCVINSPIERAKFVAMAERYILNSFQGYLDDGYCTEGISYFNYGFNHIILLRENILQATGNSLDIFSNNEKIKKIALFATHMEIANGVFPAIGDCSPYPKPNVNIVEYLNKSLGISNASGEAATIKLIPPLTNLMYFFPNNMLVTTIVAGERPNIGVRSFFEIGGILNVRSGDKESKHLAGCIKGGNNAEKHNHNDLGSFSVVKGDELLMGDPGLPIYTSKQFSPHRYTIKTNASYGHPVPLIDNRQQSAGIDARARIIRKHFTDTLDILEMDISSAYDVPSVNYIIRKFAYKRQPEVCLEVVDSVSFSKPVSYETALITRGTWKQVSETCIEIRKGEEKVTVDIDVPGGRYTVQEETITESQLPYKRIAIKIDKPFSSGSVKLSFSDRENFVAIF